MSTAAEANKAVVLHLVRLIQDSPDVRYYVGGAHTQMRHLLVVALQKMGVDGDPVEYLKPAPHHADEEPRVKRLAADIDRLEDGIARLRDLLSYGAHERATKLVEGLQAGKSASEAST